MAEPEGTLASAPLQPAGSSQDIARMVADSPVLARQLSDLSFAELDRHTDTI